MTEMDGVRWLDETQGQAWRALLVIVNRGLPQLERTLKAHGLFVVHYSILVALSAAPNHSMLLTDLADAANVSPSRLSHRMRTLLDRGDVTVTTDTDDRRSKHASLTAVGMARLQAVAPLHAEDVQRVIFDQLDASDTEALAQALSKIATALSGHRDFLPDRL